MKSFPLIVRLARGTKRSNMAQRAPSQSLALYPQADTESRFSCKSDLEPDPKPT